MGPYSPCSHCPSPSFPPTLHLPYLLLRAVGHVNPDQRRQAADHGAPIFPVDAVAKLDKEEKEERVREEGEKRSAWARERPGCA